MGRAGDGDELPAGYRLRDVRGHSPHVRNVELADENESRTPDLAEPVLNRRIEDGFFLGSFVPRRRLLV